MMEVGGRRKKKYRDFVETPTGEVIYTGGHYVYDPENPLPYRRYRIAVALACTGCAILVAAAGLYRAPGMDRTFYVLLPYVFLLGFTALMCLRGAGTVKAGNPIRAFDLEYAIQPMQHWAKVSAVFSAILLVCYFFHLIRSGREGCSMLAVVSFPLMTALIGATDLWLLQICKKNVWREVITEEEKEN